jgi:hypothetical protein
LPQQPQLPLPLNAAAATATPGCCGTGSGWVAVREGPEGGLWRRFSIDF